MTLDEVLLQLDEIDSDDEPMTKGSDDEFDDWDQPAEIEDDEVEDETDTTPASSSM